MKESAGLDFFIDQLPDLRVRHKAVIIHLVQLLIFIVLIVFFCWISQKLLIGALIWEAIVVFCGTFPYRYIVNNSKKIREGYIKKYKNLAGQKFWYHYQSYTVPLLSSAFYFPLLLKTDYFLPAIIKLPNHLITKSILPSYIPIPLGIFFIVVGYMITKPSGGFGADVGAYLYVLYPAKGRLITDGTYKYIRSPRYLGRGIIAIGFGIIANNILAILVGVIHFSAFSSLIPSEDKELIRRFGDDFKNYKNNVPALIPRFGNWIKFTRLVFNLKK